MATAFQILAGLLGLALVAFGGFLFLLFNFIVRYFDRFVASEVAADGRQTVTEWTAKIGNPLVRRYVQKYAVETGGKIAVSLARDALSSRRRAGAVIAIIGLFAIVFSSTAHQWLPRIFAP